MVDKPFGELLADRLGYWQRTLRLQDWTVGVMLARTGFLPQGASKDALAAIEIFPHRRDAVITMLHPLDLGTVEHFYIGNEVYDYDKTLVHELLRLHFLPMEVKDNGYADLAQEQAIRTMTRALVGLYRESHPLKPVVIPGSTDIDCSVSLPKAAVIPEIVEPVQAVGLYL